MESQSQSPFSVGEKINPNQLLAWTYTGLKGKPDKERDAVRRYRKGQWVIEIRAYSDRTRPASVMSMRTVAEDNEYWHAQRQHRSNSFSKK